ncbi:hypothetical protein T484DRAFT_1777444 [Baffinella frigidus]|nr:hypothetical protein T484DRAFT_1777444 [Cryptophyta sp. CCMP2293]
MCELTAISVPKTAADAGPAAVEKLLASNPELKKLDLQLQALEAKLRSVRPPGLFSLLKLGEKPMSRALDAPPILQVTPGAAALVGAAEGARIRRVAAAMMRDFQGTIVEGAVAKVL